MEIDDELREYLESLERPKGMLRYKKGNAVRERKNPSTTLWEDAFEDNKIRARAESAQVGEIMTLTSRYYEKLFGNIPTKAEFIVLNIAKSALSKEFPDALYRLIKIMIDVSREIEDKSNPTKMILGYARWLVEQEKERKRLAYVERYGTQPPIKVTKKAKK